MSKKNPSVKKVWNFFSPNHLVCFMSSEVFIVVDLFCISSIEMSNKSSKKELLKKIHAKEIVKRFVLTGYHCYLYIQLLLLFDLPSMSTYYRVKNYSNYLTLYTWTGISTCRLWTGRGFGGESQLKEIGKKYYREAS